MLILQMIYHIQIYAEINFIHNYLSLPFSRNVCVFAWENLNLAVCFCPATTWLLVSSANFCRMGESYITHLLSSISSFLHPQPPLHRWTHELSYPQAPRSRQQGAALLPWLRGAGLCLPEAEGTARESLY